MSIKFRWTLKHKPEVKVLTLLHVVLNSWALFLLSFEKVVQVLSAVPSIKVEPIHLQLGDITDTLHIKSHFRTPSQWSSLWAVRTLPSSPVSCQAESQYGFTPGNLEMEGKKELALPSSSPGMKWIFFILFPFPHITSSCQIPYYAKPSQELGCAHGG